ncbi:ABC transporter permease [Trinickia fusca]|uniref:ABC transporter permease n=1 Tax=Trinickia fusca TaxID=2419777 RepID=A0A494X0B4_9BURK|nr:ABC transporter permease [Trinickia fusca]RKP44147.1 ABC transporter permease [Trinickia fusca]
MSLSSLLLQLLNGLADASTLFLMAVGLSLVFGVSRIVNFAHGSFYMLGLYVAYTLAGRIGGTLGFWASMLLAGVVAALVAGVFEIAVLRRIYRAPELFQFLATFALVLIVKDAVLYAWGPEDLFGPRAPGLGGSIPLLGGRIPQYDLVLILIAPVVLGALWWAVNKTRAGILVRAATHDREMAGALGINQAWLFTGVFAFGCFLAGLAGALQLPRAPATLGLDLETIGDAFVVVVMGGIGSIAGTYLAALLIAELKVLCIGIGHVAIAGFDLPLAKLTLVLEFLTMACVLIARPTGLLGKGQVPAQRVPASAEPLEPWGTKARMAAFGALALLACAPATQSAYPYASVLLVDMMVAALFAASLHFILGPGNIQTFGHAAYFGIGGYGAALLATRFNLPMELALVSAPVIGGVFALFFGYFCVRLSGAYLAMLTLALVQLIWAAVSQWDTLGGSNGLIGVWPAPWLATPSAYYWLALAVCAAGIIVLRRMLFSPFGLALRACRDSALRAEALGIDVVRVRWLAFGAAGAWCGLAGALFVFSKGGISPEAIGVGKSVDGLVMVMLGGLQTLMGPVAGAAVFTWLYDTVARAGGYWHALLGAIILLIVIVFPDGLVGTAGRVLGRLRSRFFASDGTPAREAR